MSDSTNQNITTKASDAKSLLIRRINQVKPVHRRIDSNFSYSELLRSNYINQLLLYITLFTVSISASDRTKYMNKCRNNMYILGIDNQNIDRVSDKLELNEWHDIVDELFMQDKDLR